MSRSNLTSQDPNPSTRWFQWNGEAGHFRYYDKEKEQQVNLKPDFTFILLDEMNSVRGWHKPSESGIVSNAVRDTRSEPFNVRTFGGLNIASGLWAEIKGGCGSYGGRFNRDCYVAFKGDDGRLAIGTVQLKGAALGAWFEFQKANRKKVTGPNGQPMPAYYANAIRVRKVTDGRSGNVAFKVPVFELAPLSTATNEEATKLDLELQEYLKGYLARTLQPVAHPAEAPQPDANYDEPQDPEPEPEPASTPNDDVPF